MVVESPTGLVFDRSLTPPIKRGWRAELRAPVVFAVTVRLLQLQRHAEDEAVEAGEGVADALVLHVLAKFEGGDCTEILQHGAIGVVGHDAQKVAVFAEHEVAS